MPESVAQYDINQGTLALSGDYTLVYTGAKLTVTPLTINVTADAQTKVYGETDPALTYTFSPALIGADAFTGAFKDATPEKPLHNTTLTRGHWL